MLRLLIALLLPWLSFFFIGRPVQGVVCIILQLTLIGWIPAAIWAVCMIMIKSLARTDSSLTITCYMVLLMTPLALIPASLVWTWPQGIEWLWLIACGVLGTLAQWIMTQAFRVADATVVLPFDFTRLVFSALLGWILFEEFPDIWVWTGGLIILTGVLWMTRLEARGSV